MKKYVQAGIVLEPSTEKSGAEIAIQSVIADKSTKELYGIMMSLTDEEVEPWLKGVLDVADVEGLSSREGYQGLIEIYNAIQQYGITTVRSRIQSLSE